MNKELLQEMLVTSRIAYTKEQIEKYEKYERELLEYNQKVNLTAIKEDEEIIIKHFYDSLLGMMTKTWTGVGKMADLGTGAGFPGIPLKIMNPQLEVTLVDALQKRITFLELLIQRLELKQIRAVHARAEEIGQDREHREKYDLIVSRAVAKLPVLAEYCLPLIKKGGSMIAYKGPEGEQEVALAERALAILGGQIKEILRRQLPDGSERRLVVIEKIALTPEKYPRRPGSPAKKPL